MDYDVVRSSADPNNNHKVTGAGAAAADKCVHRINVRRTDHRQSIQYVPPDQAQQLVGQTAELVVIDEAAAIPIPLVRALISTGPHMVFLASTIAGYEGLFCYILHKFCLKNNFINYKNINNRKILVYKNKFQK